MALRENLLANEEIEFESQKHWIAPLRDSIVPVLLLIGAVLVGWIAPDGTGTIGGAVSNLLGLLQIGLVVVGVAMIAYNLVVWRTAAFAVSNLRVLREEGLISRRTSATLLQSVTDVKTNVPLIGSRLGYGDVVVLSQGGEKGADRFSSITQPEAFRDQVLKRKLGEASTAPSPAVPAAPPPAAAPVTPAGPATSAADDTATLARLAELRDSGAITAEEYEAKKAEILARL